MKEAPVLHAAEYAVLSVIRVLVRALPHGGARRVGRGLGTFAYRALTRRRRLALSNLELAMPELEEGEREQVARGAFRQMTSQAAELLSWDRFSPEQLCQRWTLEGWEHVTVGETGRATFFMTAHFGYWELLGRTLALYRPPVAALARPLDNPHLERLVNRSRSGFGLEIITKHGAARALTRALASGTNLIVLVDQRVRPRDAVTVPFFGQPALTTNLVARLVAKTGAPVVPLFVYPAAGGAYRIVARPPLDPHVSSSDPIRDLTSRYMAAVEAEIRRAPELWLWMHDRWRQQ